MSKDDEQTPAPRSAPPAVMSAPLALIGLLATVAVPLSIDYWMIKIRWAYMETYPEITARKPPTISRAMSDIPMGQQMATWVSVSAVLLIIGAAIVSLLYVRTARALPCPEKERRRLAFMGLAIVAVQIPVSIGMVVQSVWTLKIDNDLHMLGSYILFFSAAFGQIVAILACTAILRRAEVQPMVETHGLIHPIAARMRNWFAICSLVMVIGYLALFILKDTEMSSATLYQTYVITEVLVIASFMAYLMFHGVEFVTILWRHGRSAAASRRPASPAEER